MTLFRFVPTVFWFSDMKHTTSLRLLEIQQMSSPWPRWHRSKFLDPSLVFVFQGYTDATIPCMSSWMSTPNRERYSCKPIGTSAGLGLRLLFFYAIDFWSSIDQDLHALRAILIGRKFNSISFTAQASMFLLLTLESSVPKGVGLYSLELEYNLVMPHRSALLQQSVHAHKRDQMEDGEYR